MKITSLEEMQRLDKRARGILEAQGTVDPRITLKETTPVHYEAIRIYDSKIASEIVRLLNENSSVSEKTDNLKPFDSSLVRNPYKD